MNNKQLLKSTLIAIYPVYKVYRWIKQLIFNWRYHSVVKRNSINLYDESEQAMLYRELLSIELYRVLSSKHDWVSKNLLPVGGAADYKMLYLLARILSDSDVASILEFGAGQSTLLFSDFSRKTGARVVTVENDSGWIERISKNNLADNHRILHCPIEAQVHSNVGSANWYGAEQLKNIGSEKFDLIFIDGPVGSEAYSRVGIVQNFLSFSAPDWIAVWDDLHRIGELQSFALFLETMKKKGIQCDHVVINGIKKIGLVYTAKYSSTRHFF